jgi:hypothetical protein
LVYDPCDRAEASPILPVETRPQGWNQGGPETPVDGPNPAPAPAPAETKRRRGRHRRVDWSHAAQMLANGCTVTQTARWMGCSRQHIWRILRASDAVRLRLGEERARIAAECGAEVEGLRRQVARAIREEVEVGNVRVILWLADRLNLTGQGFPGRRLPDLPQASDAAQAPVPGPEGFATDTPLFDKALDKGAKPDINIDPVENARQVATWAQKQRAKYATVAQRRQFERGAKAIDRGAKSATRNAVRDPANGAPGP